MYPSIIRIKISFAHVLSLCALVVLISAIPTNFANSEPVPFAIQNASQSQPTEAVAESLQAVFVLPERNDSKLYVGEISYTASSPVGVNVLQPRTDNITAGASGAPLTEGLNATISVTEDLGRYSGSVSFVGSGLVLMHTEPFTASYSAAGEIVDPQPVR